MTGWRIGRMMRDEYSLAREGLSGKPISLIGDLQRMEQARPDGYRRGQTTGKDASLSRSLSHRPGKEYIFDPSDFRHLSLHEAIIRGFDG